MQQMGRSHMSGFSSMAPSVGPTSLMNVPNVSNNKKRQNHSEVIEEEMLLNKTTRVQTRRQTEKEPSFA